MGGFQYWSLGNIEIPLKPRYPPSLILSRVQNCHCSFLKRFLGERKGQIIGKYFVSESRMILSFQTTFMINMSFIIFMTFLCSLKSLKSTYWTILTSDMKLTFKTYNTIIYDQRDRQVQKFGHHFCNPFVWSEQFWTFFAIFLFDLNNSELRGLLRKMSTIAKFSRGDSTQSKYKQKNRKIKITNSQAPSAKSTSNAQPTCCNFSNSFLFYLNYIFISSWSWNKYLLSLSFLHGSKCSCLQ